MMDLLLGAVGALMVLAGFALGWRLGRRSGPERFRRVQALPQADGDEARERREREEQAFSEMLGYSAERAYGMEGSGEL